MKLSSIDVTVLLSLVLIGVGLYHLQPNLVLVFIGTLGLLLAKLMARHETPAAKENQ
jgi:hypothetical protein